MALSCANQLQILNDWQTGGFALHANKIHSGNEINKKKES